MKINNSTPPDPLRTLDRSKVDGKTKTEGAAETAQPQASTVVSHSGDISSQDIDGARVNEIREAIRDGRLDIKSEKIAEGLINSVRSMLDGKEDK